MARRLFTPIESLPLVGGAACLDFVNTTGNRAGSVPRERLGSLADVATFGHRAGLLGATEARELVRAGRQSGEGALGGVIELREALYRLFLAALEGRAPAAKDLALLNREYREAAGRRALLWSPKAPGWRLGTDAGGWQALRQAVVLSAVDLLCSSELTHLAKCGDCDWLFLDTSKNKSRRWCKKSCGDRVKARAYYRRRKARAGA